MIRANTCIGVTTGLQVAAIWLELLMPILYYSLAMLLVDKSTGLKPVPVPRSRQNLLSSVVPAMHEM